MDKTSLARYFYNLFISNDYVGETAAIYLNALINIIILSFFSFIAFKLLRYVAKSLLYRLSSKTKTQFDDFLVKNKVFVYISNLIILFILYEFIPVILIDFPDFEIYLEKVFEVVIIFVAIWILRSILMTFKDYLRTFASFKDKPIESYIQVFMIIIWIVGIIIVFSAITGKPLVKFLAALGAFSAVLLLIFKDTILGFVASIQVTVNDTVRLGDWITMEKYGADGDVYEINLASVKVRNFDNTITTIPTYYLISDSFKNWRGMSISGGRRIKRSILIKANSIKFLSESDIEELKKIKLISTYIQNKQQEVNEYNLKHKVDKTVQINGRNQTNFGAFRIYIDHYLDQHPDINKDMMMMTRQLAPTAEGIPLELYAFSKDKIWANYERVMAGIFDHLLAAIPYFELECFEYPSGKDLKSLSSTFEPSKDT
ncbi:mechanosensitive ion channel family protein [Psychroflexus sp. CAK57W]|uniref:mechanosensitive ion channel family protein n=1 Tax=Psychroflexus curvus TaxID=2873595 RepID=UPI001CCB3C0E|nr:mechanosensitive ion channel family protein [Psychroflexus curvus]MBZ9626822.1 mechanosensitive ion channel family protein [Psychroflexus curvus]MBZ9786597.1 mechanosensitive ion channel family protein [Psychroflexus curvus]